MNYQLDDEVQDEVQDDNESDPFDLGRSQQHAVVSSPSAPQPSGWGYVIGQNKVDDFKGFPNVSSINPLSSTSSHAFANLNPSANQEGNVRTGPQVQRKFFWRQIVYLCIAFFLLVSLGIGGLVAFAHTAPSLPPPAKTIIGGSRSDIKPITRHNGAPTNNSSSLPIPSPTPLPNGAAQSNSPGTQNLSPSTLPDGWANAGLSMGDALFALRTANSFVDREMSYDFRSIGTRDHHGGTFTAATFILSAGGKQRFTNNDLRVANNVLFDKVLRNKTIQSVVNEHPQLLHVQVQQNQKAQTIVWIDVSFGLWRSQVDNATDQRVEGIEIDQGTHQQLVHHMFVALLRVQPDAKGPMGGTGWLVSDYAIDTGGVLPTISNNA